MHNKLLFLLLCGMFPYGPFLSVFYSGYLLKKLADLSSYISFGPKGALTNKMYFSTSVSLTKPFWLFNDL